MASGTAGSTPSSARGRAGQPPVYDGFIEKQLNRTRARVKLVDLAGRMLVLAIAVLVYLLAIAMVDHWLVGLGSIGRFVALIGLVIGVVYYSCAQIIPLLIHRINPAYAARVIERSEPSLKNSLINFLMFRPDRATAPAVVYQALQQKAASDLSGVEIDNVIDRTQAIRMGYVLAAVFAICAIYSVASPKSTWQTMQRVVFPLSDIARPSRVTIDQVAPGDAQVYLGDSATISAEVRGIGERDEVRLIYSTADGQIVERAAPMQLADGVVRFEAVLPEESRAAGPAGSHSAGLQQDITYRIAAGDAISPQYRLEVLPAPTMFVERIEYDFPAYTNNGPQLQERQGDIKALEGTRVTIHARANYAMQSASVEFRHGSNSAPAGSAAMECDGVNAKAEFVLQLNPERTGQRYSAYELRFVTADGRGNDTPTLYRLEVLRDLDPAIEVLSPKLARIQLPEDRSHVIEVRAVDPDFALRSVKLVGSAAGGESLDEQLLPAMSDGIGQQMLRYQFAPGDMGLVAGDVFTFLAIAEDNRTSHRDGSPAPNVVQTRKYEIEITPGASPIGEEKPEEPQAGEEKSGEAGAENSRPQVPQELQPRNDDNRQQRRQDQQEQQGQSGEKQQQQGQDAQGGASGGDPQQGQQQSGQQKQNGDSQSGGKSSDPGEQGNAGGAQESGGEGAGDPGNERQANRSGEQAGESSQSGGEQNGQQGDSSQPSEQRKLHDGEVFDRVLERIEKEKQQQEAQQNQQNGQQDGQQQQPSSDAQQQPGSGQQQSGGDKPDGGQQNAAGQQHAGGQSQPNAGDPSNNAGQKSRGQQPGQSPMPQGGQQKSGDQPGAGQQGDKKNGEQPGAGQKSGDQKGGDQQSGGQQAGGKQGDLQQGNQPNGGNQGVGQAKSPAGTEGASGAQDGRGQSPQQSPGAQQGAAQDDAGKAGQPSQKAEFGDDDKTTPGAPEGGAKKGMGPEEKDENAGAGAQKNGEPGAGATPQKNGAEANRGEKPEVKDAGQSPTKEPGAGDASDAGAGIASKDTKGSPSSVDSKDPMTGQDIKENLDREKKLQPDSGKPEDADEAKVPANRDTDKPNRQSDSKGGQAGDQSGGGKQGGGQGANQEGNDSAGSNSSSDDGAGASSEAGEGETSTAAGDQQRAKTPTGQSGNEKGNGSKSTNKSQGGQSGGETAGDGADSDSQQQGEATGSAGGGRVRGGKPSGSSTPGSGESTGEVPDGDAANLDYAKNATDLVLEHLKDQQDNPDQELLDSLRMSKEELQQFIKRWDEWKRSANQAGDEQSRELDKELRSLGLRPGQRTTRRDAERNDQLRGLRDDAQGDVPLPGFRDLYRDYKKGAARAGARD